MSAVDHWTIDKRVPIATVVSIVLMMAAQTGTAVWWASAISSRVTSLEEKVAPSAAYDSRLVRLETDGANSKQLLRDISEKLDRLIERRQ